MRQLAPETIARNVSFAARSCMALAVSSGSRVPRSGVRAFAQTPPITPDIPSKFTAPTDGTTTSSAWR
jgi:hypothetical protein